MIVRLVAFVAAVPIVLTALVLAVMTWATSGGAEQIPDCTAESVVYPLPAAAALAASVGALYLSGRVRGWDRSAKVAGGLLLFAVAAMAGGWTLVDVVRHGGCFGVE